MSTSEWRFPDVQTSLTEIVGALWIDVLGADADPGKGFLENGGDSFHAVLLASRVFAATGVEIDYLDLLDADNIQALCSLVSTSTAGQ